MNGSVTNWLDKKIKLSVACISDELPGITMGNKYRSANVDLVLIVMFYELSLSCIKTLADSIQRTQPHLHHLFQVQYLGLTSNRRQSA